MNELTFDSMKALFDYIHSRGGADSTTHGQLGDFYRMMKAYMDPNTCSCKKGRNAYNNIYSKCKSLTGLKGTALVESRALFDNRIVVVMEKGHEVARF